MEKIFKRNPIYGFESVPIIEKIKSGQNDEIKYVPGEGIVKDDNKKSLLG